jgi:hypothetical protein
MCLHSVIFTMLDSIEAKFNVANDKESSASEKEKTAWTETTIVVLNGVSSLFATYLHVITKHAGFADCWQTLQDHFEVLLKLNDIDINTAVFKALQQILAHANKAGGGSARVARESIDMIWSLWSRGLPLIPGSKSNNQDCLLAYISCFQELYRLMRDYADVERTQCILNLLRAAVEKANIGSYSGDIEYLTSLQKNVLEALKMLRTDIPGVPSAIIKKVAGFSSLAFHDGGQNQAGQQQPTYVALSKESMGLLESLILHHSSDPEIYLKGALGESLSALSKPIKAKYAFSIKTKSLPPWQKATSTSLEILKATLPKITEPGIPEDTLRSIWASIVQIANGIMAADCGPALDTATIKQDQDFDISSFLTLRELIIPALGNQLIPDKTRRTFTECLFYTSLIHTPEMAELPQINTELLASLYQPRKGRTTDSLPSPRSKMSYVCLDQLFLLLGIYDSSSMRIKLAQAAAPYVILRAGLTLRAYIADQPLRGHMPQPLSQRRELLTILKGLVCLRCEPEAIPDVPGVESELKKHLHRLYPLLAKAVRAGAKDREVLEWLGKALDEVGKEFGL